MSNPYASTAYTHGYEFARGSYALPRYPFVAAPELSAERTMRHPIVIVGAGITGLTLACALARQGIAAVVLEEDDSVGVKGASSRGICYTQKSLEIFHRLGIYDRIAAKGVQWSVGRTFAGNDEVYAFDLRQHSGFQLSAQPPFINIQQFYIEGYLVERIAALGGVDLRWSSRVTACTQHAGFATLTVETPAGSYQIEADHVIDASGSHTPFHRWCGVTLQARRRDDRWCIADVRFKHLPPAERHTWIEAPFNDNRAVWQHLIADDVWRIDYQMEPDADPALVSSEAEVHKRLQRQFGDDVECEIIWVGSYAYRNQCLDKLRIGSVFFMGDTAKIVSPFGARGGNTGVADADNLAWKLSTVLQGRAGVGLLDSYNQERLEAAQQNVQVSNRTTRFLRPTDGIERTFRDAVISLARQHPFARQLVNTGRMAVANPYSQSDVCEKSGGLSVQNVHFRWQDGSQGCVNDLLQWADGRLLVLAFGDQSLQARQRLASLCAPTPALRQVPRGSARKLEAAPRVLETRHVAVRCVQVLGPDARTQSLETVRDPLGHLQGACHVFGHAWALVRPDAYLAATGEAVDSALVQAIEHALAIT